MDEFNTLGIDIAKHVFQLHGVDGAGKVVLCRRLRRNQVTAFFAALPPCLVGMEACGTAHFWAREIAALGHDVRLMPPGYVKPYVKRNKHDAADAEAVCEAAEVAVVAAQDAGIPAVLLGQRRVHQPPRFLA
jgi:transposase